jgi:hypothetical protein
VLAQSTASTEHKPLVFEVASIKRHRSGDDFAVREQPGLQLSSAQGPVQFLVIASAEPPKLDD